VHHLLEQRKIHERLAAEEGDVNGAAARGLIEQEIDGLLSSLDIHEFWLAFRRGDFVGSEFVTVLAGQVALVGEVHPQTLQRKAGGRRIERLDGRRPRVAGPGAPARVRGPAPHGDDRAGLRHFFNYFPSIVVSEVALDERGY